MRTVGAWAKVALKGTQINPSSSVVEPCRPSEHACSWAGTCLQVCAPARASGAALGREGGPGAGGARTLDVEVEDAVAVEVCDGGQHLGDQEQLLALAEAALQAPQVARQVRVAQFQRQVGRRRRHCGQHEHSQDQATHVRRA